METPDREASSAPNPASPTLEPAGEPEAAPGGDDSRLLELVGRWQEHYLREEDPTPEQLGADGSSLRRRLGRRIENQKRLFDLLGLPLSTTEEDTAGAVTAEQPPEPGGGAEPPRRIGRYLVVESLGRGGQGEVFRVVHPELGQELVIKLARRSSAADPDERDRLVREGRLLAGCDHPNLVRVVDLDFDGGRPFVVMEHVRGRNLEQFAEERRPGPRRAAELVAELARAVAYIHARGVLHLDIKPKNVVIGEGARPRLIDFGLARLRDAWAGDAAGSSGGTTSYMSPEQANGDDGRIGPWTDVFGLGGVLFYLLTGRPVYRNTRDTPALLLACRGEQVPPREIDPAIPRSLERICRKALAIDPSRRYRSADELERALRGYLARPRVVVVFAGAVILATLAVAGFGFRAGREAGGPRVAAAPAPVADAPRIVAFEVRHYRGDDPPRLLGTIGASSGALRFDDDVRVVARLDRPAYCYLVALNPDGRLQWCHPSSTDERPVPTDEVIYPSGDLYFPLTDGVGLQAFVLVASRSPLPPMAEWAGKDAMRWEAVPADGAGVWSFDGRNLEPLGDVVRGEPRRRPGPPSAFERLCRELERVPGVDALRAIAFPVVGR